MGLSNVSTTSHSHGRCRLRTTREQQLWHQLVSSCALVVMPMVWLTIPTVEDGVALKWINSMLLPKGKENGLEMVLMAFLEDGEADKADDFTIDVNNEFGGTHAHCGIHGQKVPDKRAMGYPLDRPILDFRMTASIPNFKTTLVKVYHKPSE